MELEKNDYRNIVDFTRDTDYNWKKLIKEHEKETAEYLPKTKKKKRGLNRNG
jgi:ATP-dependent RNA helicase RhlE